MYDYMITEAGKSKMFRAKSQFVFKGWQAAAEPGSSKAIRSKNFPLLAKVSAFCLSGPSTN